MPAPLAAVLDANVLIPAAPRDTLLRAAEARLYRLHWSSEILAEVERNLVNAGLTDEVRAKRLVELLDAVFPEANVTGYEHLTEELKNHPKDRHVLAAAIHAGAHAIVTENVSDFPHSALIPHGVAVYSIDEFLTYLMALAPEVVVRIIEEQAADLANPPLTVRDVVDQIAPAAPTFATMVARFLPS